MASRRTLPSNSDLDTLSRLEALSPEILLQIMSYVGTEYKAPANANDPPSLKVANPHHTILDAIIPGRPRSVYAHLRRAHSASMDLNWQCSWIQLDLSPHSELLVGVLFRIGLDPKSSELGIFCDSKLSHLNLIDVLHLRLGSTVR